MIDVENTTLEYFEEFKKKRNAKRYSEDCDDKDLRDAIRGNLLIKQKNQCAYCENKITKIKSTIEHINPRDKSPKLECEYSNIILSCQSKDSCDKYKDNNIWADRYIHPVLNNPEEYFHFSSNGKIVSDDKNAVDTISYLKLNSDKLIRVRKNIIYSLQSMVGMENISSYFHEHENLIKQYT